MGIISNRNENRYDLRREQLLLVAQELFAKNGYHKTKISDIVAEAGVSQGTFYWYFKSKQAVALEIVKSGKEQLLKVIHKGYRTSLGTSGEMVAGSKRLLFDILVFSKENPYFMKLLLVGNSEDESLQKACHQARLDMESAFYDNIKSAIALGMLPSMMDVHMCTAFLMSLIEGTIARWLFGPVDEHSTLLNHTPEELAEKMVKFEFFGLFAE
ncbi:TetR/AcrR family transcriptional regulator [Neobacillus mesonae]|uniref:TetR/AcrR family transcriptional regulator n=1 Tax=Neobacillus mesonae TaxID=1193713 RepID=UPI00203C39AE|nr:TetR/AcrR family transcriptional regulator [Neobacillus mesonae]MCM3568671.1 TetR/AcrR family transcriptional regulator [Neobacillus mesonae]